jgi:hypothetical protein
MGFAFRQQATNCQSLRRKTQPGLFDGMEKGINRSHIYNHYYFVLIINICAVFVKPFGRRWTIDDGGWIDGRPLQVRLSGLSGGENRQRMGEQINEWGPQTADGGEQTVNE